MKKVLWFALWASGFLANLFFILRWLTGDQFLVVRMTNYFLPWIGLSLSICFILSVCSKKGKLSLLLSVPLGIITASYAPLMLRCGISNVADGTTLRVMSYNICRDNQDMSTVAAIIQRENPDILLLQEVNPEQLKTLFAALRPLHKNENFNITHDPANLVAVASRFQIKESESLPHKNRSQKVHLASPYGNLTVINVHGVRAGWSIRHKGIEDLLREDVHSEEGPVILGGDLNTNDQSQTFKLIEKHLVNTHNEAGCGFGFTFPAKSYNFPYLSLKWVSFPPFIRIDHLFHSNHFVTLTSSILEDSGGSDHLPVVAELALLNAKRI